MKTTIELAKECGIEKIYLYSTIITNDASLEAFRKACEANFISRCIYVGEIYNTSNEYILLNDHDYELEHGTKFYTLPKE